MKIRSKVFWALFIVFLLILISIISLNYELINFFIEENVYDYGYSAIFIFSFLCDIIDQPVIVEVPATLGVIYGLNVLNVFLIAGLGMSIAGVINFYIGRKFFSKKIKDFCTTKTHLEYCKLFFKYGKLSLLIAALTPAPYVTFVWLSGAFGMRFKHFFVFGVLAKIFRLGVILLLGYLAFG